jgi:hypothetical protein
MVLFALAGAATIGGCAWSSPPPPPPPPGHSFKTKQVIKDFEKQTGKHLDIDTANPAIDDSLSLGRRDPTDPKFGSFVVWVAHTGLGQQYIVSDPNRRRLPKSKDGFYWEMQPGSTTADPSWQATKKYGGNVFVTYFGGNPDQPGSLGPPYTRLDAAMTAMIKAGT